jgi:tetratricopeptide (TPR) repeat protein
LNPHNAEALAEFGMRLALMGQWRRGISLIDEAIARNPAHPGWYHTAPALDFYRQGRYAEALERARQTLRRRASLSAREDRRSSSGGGRVASGSGFRSALSGKYRRFLVREAIKSAGREMPGKTDRRQNESDGFGKELDPRKKIPATMVFRRSDLCPGLWACRGRRDQ